MDPLSTLAPLTPTAPEATQLDKGSANAAKEFESYLVTFLAQQMRKTVKDGPFSSGATAMFADLFDQEIGRRVSEGRGLGLRAQLEQALAGFPAAEPTSVPHHAARVVRNHNADARVTSPFGERVDPIDGKRRRHAGVDLAAALGTPVRAVKDGVVRFAGDRGGYGNVVIVDHGDGSETRYAHCDTLDVKAGQAVRAGQDIATVGSTGRSTGPHLHFEFRVRGAATDPSALLDGAFGPLRR